MVLKPGKGIGKGSPRTCSEAQLISFLAGVVIEGPHPHPSGSLPGLVLVRPLLILPTAAEGRQKAAGSGHEDQLEPESLGPRAKGSSSGRTLGEAGGKELKDPSLTSATHACELGALPATQGGREH